MGLSIGQASIAVSTASTAAANRVNRPDTAPAAPRDEAAFVQREESSPPQAGFGENTLSPLSAALEALDTNLEVAAEAVPTVEELRERARVVQAERLDEATERRPIERPDELRRRETVRPEPDPAVRNFPTESRSVAPDTRLAPATPPERLGPISDVATTPDPNARIDVFA